MFLKILKIVGLVLLGIFLLLFGISFSKVDKNSTNKIKDAWSNLFKGTASKILLGNDSTDIIDDGATTPTPKVNKQNNSVSTNPVVTLNPAGVNTSNYLGTFMVSGTWVKVYGYNQNISLLEYENAFGFLQDGTIVYRDIVNAGYENEYETYHL